MSVESAPPQGITLYSHADDFRSHWIRYVLAEKQIKYHLILADEEDEDLASLNPYNQLPMLLEKVQTVVTPGETVDVLVTDYGIAINPKRLDLYEILQKTSLPVMTVEELHQKAQKLAGVAEKTILGDRVCGLVEYRDGTIIDVVYDLP